MGGKIKPEETAAIIPILRILREDRYMYGDSLNVPSFESVIERAQLVFRAPVPAAMWRTSVAALDSQECLDRATDSSNRTFIWVNDNGLEVLRLYDEGVEKNKPKTNWQMLGVLVALAALAATALGIALLRRP